jgi:outer membrane protein assembly factor BamD (BamD/ComL family)
VVAIGIKLGSFDWVDYFIKTYSKKIAPAHRETMSSYCRARLAYGQKNYQEAVSLLQKADYNDLLLHLAAKTILMKIYFETDENRLLDALLDSMTNFLRRKKIIGYHRENYLNIVKYGRRLAALNRFDRVACDLFKTAITEEPNLTERNWFLQFLGKY